MGTALAVTTKMLWKRTWLPVLFWSGVFVLIPFMFLRIEQYLAGPVGWRCGNRSFDEYVFYYILYLWWTSFISISIGVETTKGFRKFSLGLPLSSRTIASGIMFTVVALFISMQLVIYGLYRLLILEKVVSRDFWPMTGPLSFSVTLILVGYCFYWLLQIPSLPRLLAAIILVPGMLVWFVARFFPDGLNHGVEPWNRVTPGEWGTMLGVSLGAWYLGTVAFAQVRAGTGVPGPVWERLREWWKTLTVGTASDMQTSQPSLTAMLAQTHWRDSGRRAVMTGGVLAGLLQLAASGLLGVLMYSNNAYLREISSDSFMMDLVGMLVAISTLFCCIAVLVVAGMIGRGISSKAPEEMKRFLAQAPISDSSLNRILTRNLVRAFGYTFLINQMILLVCLSVVALIYGWHVFSALLYSGTFHVRFLLHLPLLLCGLWLIGANVAASLWSDRGKLLAVAGLSLELVFILYGMAGYLLREYSGNFFLRGAVLYGMLLSVYLPLLWGMFHAFRTACRKQLLTRGQVRLALSAWSVAAIVLLIYHLSLLDHFHKLSQLGVYWLIYTGLCALFLLPFALLPLAVSWNRHR
ncbi:hypothetical protein Pan153_59890 [Gimesia panareensis]|uniref:Uncharacterized protein n=1 Tax=Gimesia panareensis TaxID=2527978 RepID=A0A518FYC1_9PLAN|nr:hypothetical protein [Gimesia panareensis]QDV21301.1 hypothetical protein Pan153_59890 [Gimesia panareensis]